MAHGGPWREAVTIERRLFTPLLLVCAAPIGVSIASAEIFACIDWAARDGVYIDQQLTLPTGGSSMPARSAV